MFSKHSFGGSKQLIEYLGKYTHKVAITNHLIKEVNPDTVTFFYKDYRTAGIAKQMALSYAEVVRRFAQHLIHHDLFSSSTITYSAAVGNEASCRHINNN